MIRFFAAAGCAIVLLLSQGCVLFSRSEASGMQADISALKLDVGRLKEQMDDNYRRLSYSLTQIEESLDIRQETLNSSLRNVEEKLTTVSETVTPPPMPGASSPAAVEPPTEASETMSGPGGMFEESPAMGATGASAGEAAAPQPEAMGIAPPTAPIAEATPAPAQDAEADALFRQATQSWFDGNVDGAQEQYGQFLSLYPDHPKAAEAAFWVGECRYSKKQYQGAIQDYLIVVGRYPGSQFEADAAAKIGYCYFNLGEKDLARQALESVIERYPDYSQIETVRSTLKDLE